MLTENQKSIIKTTVPVLSEHGVDLTSHFYKRMLSENPELKQVFNRGHQEAGKQQHALAGAVLAYAQNIDDPTILKDALVHIAHKHVSLGIRAEHYPIVGKHLLASIREVLGEAATDQLIEAWGLAYQQLADLLIGMETKLYGDLVKEGAWTGWRSFKIVKKIAETDQITSFYFKPIDNGKLPVFHPGQYISVRVYVPEWDLIQPRQYTLSDAPGKDTYRISVKREDGTAKTPAGHVSNVLHKNFNVGDVIDIAPPSGEFCLNEQSDKPVYLISAGVGITPMISMLIHLAQQQTKRPVSFIHGTRNIQTYAMHSQVNNIVEKNNNFEKIIFYSNPEDQDNQLDYLGRVNLLALKDKITPNGEYYLCGPVDFMQERIKDLKNLGVPAENIHAEAFDTGSI
ncbi:Hemoglobin-like flavoprotein (Hmp) (PDB:3OZU) [Commensalibacter communis]|uniref:NO-inducible flavohemoprotein n=1 Tax=Commensalibacter communis TaxID=2972786 RepID=UPI0022FF63A6|nr:NO-inducible flavohemoprotein [Commensalibacter communis]CAI3924497.1 Hemoglobin-like flavoprotein (Hmp) (PDB:3OZU) [Commensalibacter communis]CAI3934646.1 Hemoglobin-like flavoprotein (Hmp) (PDB:3OZU) [Commensalibacter communis]